MITLTLTVFFLMMLQASILANLQVEMADKRWDDSRNYMIRFFEKGFAHRHVHFRTRYTDFTANGVKDIV